MKKSEKMKSLIASICILGLVGMVVGVAVQGADTAPVSATVTPKLITVSVSPGTVAYGILGTNTTTSTIPAELDQTQTATDGSNVDVALNIKSSDAVGGTPWELAAAAGENAFVHKFKGGDAADWTQLPVDNTTYATLDAKPAAGSVAFDLQITTPTITTDYVLKTITVTVQVTE